MADTHEFQIVVVAVYQGDAGPDAMRNGGDGFAPSVIVPPEVRQAAAKARNDNLQIARSSEPAPDERRRTARIAWENDGTEPSTGIGEGEMREDSLPAGSYQFHGVRITKDQSGAVIGARKPRGSNPPLVAPNFGSGKPEIRRTAQMNELAGAGRGNHMPGPMREAGPLNQPAALICPNCHDEISNPYDRDIAQSRQEKLLRHTIIAVQRC